MEAVAGGSTEHNNVTAAQEYGRGRMISGWTAHEENLWEEHCWGKGELLFIYYYLLLDS